MNLEYARAAGEAGMSQAYEHAKAVTPEWEKYATAILKSYCQFHRTVFAEDVVRVYEHVDLPRPASSRAWGKLFQRAVKDGWLVDSGTCRPRTKGHGSKAVVWT